MDLRNQTRSADISESKASSWTLYLIVIFFTAFALGDIPNAITPSAKCEPIEDKIFGTIIVVDKPVSAVFIDSGEIPVGKANTYIYNLLKDHRYHVYLTGDWANPKTHLTDYDVYVYKFTGISGYLLSSHTESAGLPEQVSSDSIGQYFIPDESGAYYFTVRNDALESNASEPGTLMVLEHIETDTWIRKSMNGKVNEQPVRETTWAYEFVSSAPRIRVYIDVPSYLDMYEARLYIVGNPAVGKGQVVKGIPIAWEPGLRGLVSGVYGGFNFDPQGYRNMDAMASCQRNGEDMIVDYKVPVKGSLLYHLVLIAEYGSGTLNFVVQTDFEPPTLEFIDPPASAVAESPTKIEARVVDASDIVEVSCFYTRDGGAQIRADVEAVGEGLYVAEIPGVHPGSIIEYAIEAEDLMGNRGSATGIYSAIGQSSLRMYLNQDTIYGGEAIVPWGFLDPGGRNVEVRYLHGEDEYNFNVTAADHGYFNHSFNPMSLGEWQVYGVYAGDEDHLPSSSDRLNFSVVSQPTDLMCQLGKGRLEFGFSVKISGAFSLEKEGVPVELVLKSKDGFERLWAETSLDGSYSADFKPSSKGSWTIQARVAGDGLTYSGAESEVVTLQVVNPSLTTTLLRLPSTLASRGGFLVKPPYLYGLLGALGAAGGGLLFYLRRRE